MNEHFASGISPPLCRGLWAAARVLSKTSVDDGLVNLLNNKEKIRSPAFSGVSTGSLVADFFSARHQANKRLYGRFFVDPNINPIISFALRFHDYAPIFCRCIGARYGTNVLNTASSCQASLPPVSRQARCNGTANGL